MYPRNLRPPSDQSFFLLGPRGIGKTCFIRKKYKKALKQWVFIAGQKKDPHLALSYYGAFV